MIAPLRSSTNATASAKWQIENEARALLTRLALVKPFALLEGMVAAAAFSPEAQVAIDEFLAGGRKELRLRLEEFLRWLKSDSGQYATAVEVQRRFAFLRLRFNATLTHFDLFADVLTQRSEQSIGVWLAGLDAAALDALMLPATAFTPPPVICYLDRGHGASIRRARTRLPGGGLNPAAIIRVPRERMIGSGVASSLVHEVGHQGVVLLDLMRSIRPVLHKLQRTRGIEAVAWQVWERWLSEVLADMWSVARVGVASTLGLIALVTLPRAFVFRLSLDDPHPMPWLRVLLSCAIGEAFFPHPQWRQLSAAWTELYPLPSNLPKPHAELMAALCGTTRKLAQLLAAHRPPALRGASLQEAFAVEERQPNVLSAAYRHSNGAFAKLRDLPPSFVLAVLGQAKLERRIAPEDESRLLSDLLTYWALRRSSHATRLAAGSRRPAWAAAV